MTNVTFLNPGFFWLLLLIPVLIAWQIWTRNSQMATLKMSSLKGFQHSKSFFYFCFAFKIKLEYNVRN